MKIMPKRIGFSSIQADANIACVGYETMPLRTGYDNVIPYRVSSLFASMASDDGIVISKTPFELLVQFKDKTTKKIPIGRQYGQDGGLTVPHLLVSDLKEGDKFKKGDCLTYNKGYFTKDPLDKSKITLKMGVLANVAILENSHTLEDGSVVTKKLADKLSSYQTKIRDIRVNFDQEIHNLVKPGQAINSDEILCIIEDSVTSKGGLFDEESIEFLKQLASKSPKAKINGTVEKIEAFYHGNKEDMSESLKSLVNKTDKLLLDISKAKGGKGHNGKVHSNYLIDGSVVELNQVVIRIYISGLQGNTSGDKLVFSHQMKSTISSVLPESPVTEDNDEIDAIFGARSINARIVNSPYIVGTTNTLLVEIGKLANKMYFNK